MNNNTTFKVINENTRYCLNLGSILSFDNNKKLWINNVDANTLTENEISFLYQSGCIENNFVPQIFLIKDFLFFILPESCEYLKWQKIFNTDTFNFDDDEVYIFNSLDKSFKISKRFRYEFEVLSTNPGIKHLTVEEFKNNFLNKYSI